MDNGSFNCWIRCKDLKNYLINEGVTNKQTTRGGIYHSLWKTVNAKMKEMTSRGNIIGVWSQSTRQCSQDLSRGPKIR